MKPIVKAFEAMIKGKAFRLTKEARESYKKIGGFSDIWFVIIAVHSDSTITLSGNNHMILENESLDSITNL